MEQAASLAAIRSFLVALDGSTAAKHGLTVDLRGRAAQPCERRRPARDRGASLAARWRPSCPRSSSAGRRSSPRRRQLGRRYDIERGRSHPAGAQRRRGRRGRGGRAAGGCHRDRAGLPSSATGSSSWARCRCTCWRTRAPRSGSSATPPAGRGAASALAATRRTRGRGVSMHVVIMGCGRVGSTHRHAPRPRGARPSPSSTRTRTRSGGWAPSSAARSSSAPGSTSATLEAAGIREADAFLALTQGDNRNLLAAQMAKHIFDVPVVVARVYDPFRGEIFAQPRAAHVQPHQRRRRHGVRGADARAVASEGRSHVHRHRRRGHRRLRARASSCRGSPTTRSCWSTATAPGPRAARGAGRDGRPRRRHRGRLPGERRARARRHDDRGHRRRRHQPRRLPGREALVQGAAARSRA